MTLSELIATLTDLAEGIESDPEVKIAFQPSWPMEAEIGFVGSINHEAEDLDLFVPAVQNTVGVLEPTTLYLYTVEHHEYYPGTKSDFFRS